MTEFVKERAVYVNDEECHYFWSDLSPFTQGYIEALFANEDEAALADFSDLAPETLARIIADCEIGVTFMPHVIQADPTTGAAFWRDRQSGMWENAAFPPLTIQISDDGKVRFAA